MTEKVLEQVIDRPFNLNMELYEKYYHWNFICSNCNKRNHKMILKGVQHSACAIECSNCGCVVKG